MPGLFSIIITEKHISFIHKILFRIGYISAIKCIDINNLKLLLNKALLRDVDTVQELTDILVADSGDLLDVSSRLGDILKRVSGKDQLILLGSRDLDVNTLGDLNLTNTLLTQEVSDLNNSSVINDVNVDGEMCVDISHLVLVTLGNTGDQVSNKRLDGSESSNVLSVSVVDSDLDSLVRDLAEGNINVSEVLGKATSGSSNGNDTGLDVNGNTLRDVKDLVGLDELHCCGDLGGILGSGRRRQIQEGRTVFQLKSFQMFGEIFWMGETLSSDIYC